MIHYSSPCAIKKPENVSLEYTDQVVSCTYTSKSSTSNILIGSVYSSLQNLCKNPIIRCHNVKCNQNLHDFATQESVVDDTFSVCRDVSLLLAFVSALLMLPSWWKESSWLLWGVVLLVYSVFRVWGTWRTAKLQMSLRKYCVQLEETVANSRAFTNLVRKALRLIQETEVISRGFTL